MTCREIIKGKWSTREVWVGNKKLSPKVDQGPNHSAEFNWGYGGSGPAQLAYMILKTLTNGSFANGSFANLSFADLYYQDFKWDFINKLPQADFIIPLAEVEAWIALRALRSLNG